MKRFIALAAAAMLAACQPMPEKGTIDTTDVPPAVAVPNTGPSQTCAQRGGTMKPVGRAQTVQCVVSYSDAGKRCTDGDQCQGDCRLEAAPFPQAGASATGQCQAESTAFGCYAKVEDGKAQPAICVD